MNENLPSVRDALVIAGAAVGVYVVLFAAAKVLRRGRTMRFGATFHLFALAAGLTAGIRLSHWDTAWGAILLQQLAAATIVFGAFPAVAVANRILWVRITPDRKTAEVPRVLLDVTGFAIIVVAALLALQYVYGVQVPGLVAGSGVIAIILGLALQDLLGNLIAGVSLYFDKNFTTGDWVLIEGTHAKVIELSWRSTRLLTTDDVLIDVPNSAIAKQNVMNFEKPTPRHAVRATLGLHYDVPPARAQAVLRAAAASVPGVCAEPAPVIYVKDLGDSAIVYEVKVWIDDHALMSRVLSEVRSHCWYAVRRAGMEIPYPQLTLHRARAVDTDSPARETAARALRAHTIFGFLGGEQIDGLVRASPIVLFSPGEHVIDQGAAGDSMFMVVQGRVEVSIARDGKSAVVAKLGTGDCFGEMSLLTGEPRTATVIAQGEVEAVEIRKDVFAGLVRQNPDVVSRLGDLLTQRQLANEQHAAASTPAAHIEQTRLGVMRRLRSFFQLGE